MKTVGFIPYWLDYNPDKNKKKLGGQHVLNYSVNLLSSSTLIDDVIIYASEPDIAKLISEDQTYTFIKRPLYLDSPEVHIENVISEFIKNYDADTIVLLHPNCPFLQLATLDQCIQKVNSNEYDSAFTAYKFKKFVWYENNPLNYNPSLKTPHLKDIEPVIIEQASLYVFERKMFLKNMKRIGRKPYIKFINQFEGHDINDDKGFEIAELIVDSGMFYKV